MLLRFVFSKNIGLSLLIIWQFLFSALSVYYLAKCIYLLTNKKSLFLIGFFSYLFFSYIIQGDLWTLPESFSVSAYIFHLYFFIRFWKENKNKNLIISGGFLTWAIFLRGFLLTYLISSTIILLWLLYKMGLKLKLAAIKLMLFFLPFIIAESIWITRNYMLLHQFIPLQTIFVPGQKIDANVDYKGRYKNSVLALRKLVVSWGGNAVDYYPDSETGWFLSEVRKQGGNTFPFPNKIFFTGFTKDSVYELKHLITISFKDTFPVKEHLRIENLIINKSMSYISKIRQQKPFIYYFESRVKRIKNFLLQSVVSNWPGPPFRNSSLLYKFYKLCTLFFYYLILSLSFFALIYQLLFNRRLEIGWYLSLNFFILLVTFSYLIESAENKYFLTGFINAFILSYIMFPLIMNRFRKDNKNY